MEHLKAASFFVLGVESRFCQRCGLSHPLEEFDGKRKSCRKALEKHNNRRRARQMGATGAAQEATDDAPSGAPAPVTAKEGSLDLLLANDAQLAMDLEWLLDADLPMMDMPRQGGPVIALPPGWQQQQQQPQAEAQQSAMAGPVSAALLQQQQHVSRQMMAMPGRVMSGSVLGQTAPGGQLAYDVALSELAQQRQEQAAQLKQQQSQHQQQLKRQQSLQEDGGVGQTSESAAPPTAGTSSAPQTMVMSPFQSAQPQGVGSTAQVYNGHSQLTQQLQQQQVPQQQLQSDPSGNGQQQQQQQQQQLQLYSQSQQQQMFQQPGIPHQLQVAQLQAMLGQQAMPPIQYVVLAAPGLQLPPGIHLPASLPMAQPTPSGQLGQMQAVQNVTSLQGLPAQLQGMQQQQQQQPGHPAASTAPMQWVLVPSTMVQQQPSGNIMPDGSGQMQMPPPG